MPPEEFAQSARSSPTTPGATAPPRSVCVGWTQHTVGVQNIRTAAILQLLLGNIGRPGGGILALRGHASIQGSTDIPTLFDLLPGYLPMPHVHGNEDLATYVDAESMDTGFWANFEHVRGQPAQGLVGRGRDHGQRVLLRLPAPADRQPQHLRDRGRADQRRCKGYFMSGRTRPSARRNGRLQRFGLANLDWLVVRDLVMIESATFWQNGPEIETGEMRTQDIGTEVFFLPAAAHTEKNGSFTNTQRLLQWHDKAVARRATRAATCGSSISWAPRLGKRLCRRRARRDGPARAGADLGLPGGRAARRAVDRRGAARSTAGTRSGKPLSSFTELKDDGSTACGCWIYSGVRAEASIRPPPQAGHRAELGGPGLGLGVAGESAHPVQSRLRRPRRPAVERPQGTVWWDEEQAVDRGRCAGLRRRPTAVLPARRGRHGRRCDLRHRSVHHDADGKAWLFAPKGVLDGPLPTHYEP